MSVDARVFSFLLFVFLTGFINGLTSARAASPSVPTFQPSGSPSSLAPDAPDALTGGASDASDVHTLSAQSRDAAYFMPTGISALGALLFLKVKAVLVVLVAVLIISLLSKVAGGYGIPCGGGPMCAASPHTEYAPSGHSAYRDDYMPQYEPTATGPYARSADPAEEDGILSRMLNRVNIVDLGFAVMDIPSNICRKRLVCEMDNSALKHPPLAFLIDTFGESLSKYRDEALENRPRNCAQLYPHCETWFPLNIINSSMPG